MVYQEYFENCDFLGLTEGELLSEEFEHDYIEYCATITEGRRFRIDSAVIQAAKQYDKAFTAEIKRALAAWKKDAAVLRKKNLPEKRSTEASNLAGTGYVDTNILQLNSVQQNTQSQVKGFMLTDEGIMVPAGEGGWEVVCETPFTVTAHFINRETGQDSYELTYIRVINNKRMVTRKIYHTTTLENRKNITQLFGDGFLISSENAGYCVQYIQACIAAGHKYGLWSGGSTGRMGWINGEFCPYGQNTYFDGETEQKNLLDDYTSVKGNKEDFLNFAREYRKLGALEVNVQIAAVMASFLMGEFVSMASAIIDTYARSNQGKTMTLLLAFAQIGAPSMGVVIGSWKTSRAGIQSKFDSLYGMPKALDDSANMDPSIEKDQDGFIYDLVNGVGKTLGKQDGGTRRTKQWSGLILTTGEAPLSDRCIKGGAINRIIEIPAGRIPEEMLARIFNFVQDNHGHVVRDFLAIVSSPEGRTMVGTKYNEYCDKIKGLVDATTRQYEPLALILTADDILTDYIYKDGIYLRDKLPELVQTIKTKKEISDDERAAEYLADYYIRNKQLFFMNNRENPMAGYGEQLGWISEVNGVKALIITTEGLGKILKSGGFNKKMFITWAKNQGLILDKTAGTESKVHRCGEDTIRSFAFDLAKLMPTDEAEQEDQEKEIKQLSEYLESRKFIISMLKDKISQLQKEQHEEEEKLKRIDPIAFEQLKLEYPQMADIPKYA